MNITLNERSKRSIEKVTGVNFDAMLSMDATSLDAKIEKKIGKKLTFKAVADERLMGRGSVYLALNCFFVFSHKRLNRIIERRK